MTTAPVITINDLRKSYSAKIAVDGINLKVRRGEIFGVLGPNGAGKTTTVETVAGLRRPDAGTVRVLGLDPTKDPAAVRQRVGVTAVERRLRRTSRAAHHWRCSSAAA